MTEKHFEMTVKLRLNSHISPKFLGEKINPASDDSPEGEIDRFDCLDK